MVAQDMFPISSAEGFQSLVEFVESEFTTPLA